MRPFLFGACSWPHSCAHFSCAQRDQLAAQARLRWVADSDHERQEIDKQRREERRRLEDAQEKLVRTEERRVAELKVERETAEAELRRRHATEVRRSPT